MDLITGLRTGEGVHVEDDVQSVDVGPVQGSLEVRELGARDERFVVRGVPDPVGDGDPESVQTVIRHPITHPASLDQSRELSFSSRGD